MCQDLSSRHLPLSRRRRTVSCSFQGALEEVKRVTPLLRIVFASTSGHTEYVVDTLIRFLEQLAPGRQILATIAEKTQPEDMLAAGLLVLASATWNTGGVEGQLNSPMSVLLQEKAGTLDLRGEPCACIGLGDDRYFYKARAADLLEEYVKAHHGVLMLPSLRIINEPYGQEETIRRWAEQLVEASVLAIRY